MQEQEPSVEKTSGQTEVPSVDFYLIMRVVKIIPFVLLAYCLANVIMMLYFPAQIIYLEVGALLLYLFVLIRYRLIQDFMWPIAKIVYQALTGKVELRDAIKVPEDKP